MAHDGSKENAIMLFSKVPRSWHARSGVHLENVCDFTYGCASAPSVICCQVRCFGFCLLGQGILILGFFRLRNPRVQNRRRPGPMRVGCVVLHTVRIEVEVHVGIQRNSGKLIVKNGHELLPALEIAFRVSGRGAAQAGEPAVPVWCYRSLWCSGNPDIALRHPRCKWGQTHG